MLRLMLNVGKNTSDRFGIPTHHLADTRIRAVLQSVGFTVRQYAVKMSNTEETAIVLVQDDMPLHRVSVRDRIVACCFDLKQDCIAVVPLVHGTSMVNYDMGQLIGPYAEAWGGFDQTFFLEAA
ncbi:hypothetical protein X534_gp08 [Ralstonia phage RSB3]|uniref:Uncharacterized protein n=1 Tax=Ralstonia phage RSB3 TaxID=1402875 RepID=U3TM15_9CAUD|nr:hypothetical protein X534_gp08 [Ralstonia phage RSB3]BAN92319.1 hypothetical protein [Ralstonia phage RSB3]